MICCEAGNKQSVTRAAQRETCSSSLHPAEGQTGILAVSPPSSSDLTARDRVLEEHSVPSPAAHLPLRCRNSLPSSLTQIETDEVEQARLRTAAHDAWTWQTAPPAGMLALGTASGGLWLPLCLILQHPKATGLGHCCCTTLYFQLP